MVFGNYSDQEKISILRMLRKAAEADGNWNSDEVAFLRAIAARMKAPFEFALTGSFNGEKPDLPKNEAERLTILYHILFMIRMDEDIDRMEVQTRRQLAFRLGIRTDMTEDLLRLIIEYSREEIPPALMFETITKYMN